MTALSDSATELGVYVKRFEKAMASIVEAGREEGEWVQEPDVRKRMARACEVLEAVASSAAAHVRSRAQSRAFRTRMAAFREREGVE